MMLRPTGRRQFLGQAIAATVAIGAGRLAPRAGADEPRPATPGANPPIVDSHVHLWDLSRFRLPWLQAPSDLARNFLAEDYARAAEGLGVVKAIYMEVDVDPAQHHAEADYVVDLCRRGAGSMVAAVIGGRPASDDFADYIARYKDEPRVKGVRQVLHGSTPKGYCLDPNFVRGIRKLGDQGLSFDLCIRPADLPDVTRLVAACPGTSFVLDHCGNPDINSKDLSAWRADLSALAERPNVTCKVSGFIGAATPGAWTADDLAPIVNHVFKAFGPDRVLFAGDWPVCTKAATLKQWVEALREVLRERPEAERKKFFADNAARIYRLG